MWDFDHASMHLAEVRGGIRGMDSLPPDFDLTGVDGGKVNTLSGRDYYVAQMNDSVATPSDDAEPSEAIEGRDRLDGRALWLSHISTMADEHAALYADRQRIRAERARSKRQQQGMRP
jgi:hypothetical protein